MIILPSLKARPCHKCSTPTYARHIVKGPTKRSKPARLPLCACCQLGPQKAVEILPTIPYFGKDGTAAATVPDTTKRTQVLAWLKDRENKTWRALGNSYSAKMKNWAAALKIPVPDLTALRGGPRNAQGVPLADEKTPTKK